MIVWLRVPIVLEARTNSRVRRDKNSPRTRRAVNVQPVKAKIKISLSTPGWKMVTNVISKKMVGIEMMTSTIRIRIASIFPPKYPATAPITVPIVMEPATEANPTQSDILAP